VDIQFKTKDGKTVIDLGKSVNHFIQLSTFNGVLLKL
jgi:hypothetical protein